jgi:hypothetical protein
VCVVEGGGGGEWEGGAGAGYRCPYVDVGPFVQQDRHNVRSTKATGVHQGRQAILQRVDVVGNT